MTKLATRIELVAFCPALGYKMACTDRRCHARHDRHLRGCVQTSQPMAMACVTPPHHPVYQIAARVAAARAAQR